MTDCSMTPGSEFKCYMYDQLDVFVSNPEWVATN